MSLYGPTVQNAPFTGLGDAISGGLQDFLRARQFKQQRDLEAAQTGVGLTPVTPYDVTPQAPPEGGLTGALKSGWNRLTGHPNIQTTTGANAATMNQYAADQATDNQNSIKSAFTGAPAPAPVTQTGLDANGIPLQSRLPSGQILTTAETPFGRNEALVGQRAGVQYGLQGLKGQQRMQQIGLTTQGKLAAIDDTGQWRDLNTGEVIDSREMIAANRDKTTLQATQMRDNTSLQTTGMRDNTSTLNHNTPSASTIYQSQHSLGGGTVSQPNYLLKRIPQLTQPDKFGRPGLSRADATRQALAEYGAATGSDGQSSTPPPAPPSPTAGTSPVASPSVPAVPSQPTTSPGGMNPTALAAHQKIDANLAAAVKAGADPQKAMQRAAQLHAQVGGQ